MQHLLFIVLSACLTGGFFAVFLMVLFRDKCLVSFVKEMKPVLSKQVVEALHVRLSEPGFLKSRVLGSRTFRALKPDFETELDSFLQEKVLKKWPAIALFGGEELVAKMKHSLLEEAEAMLPALVEKYRPKVLSKEKWQRWLENEVQNIPDEQIALGLRPSLRKIKRVFVSAAFLIGLASGFFLWLFQLLWL